MKFLPALLKPSQTTILLGTAVLLLAAGCTRESEQPVILTQEQITGNVPEVFKGAPPEVAQLAADVVESVGAKDSTTAWAKLQQLNARPDLTEEQKTFVAESISSLGAEVNKAEQAGDEAAQKALEFYRANK